MPPTLLRAHRLALAFVLLAPAPGRAQEIVDHWRVQAELGFNGAAGNSSFAILRTGFKATHLKTDVAEFEVSALVRYGKNDQKVIADDARGSLKFDLWPDALFSPFVFADAARDRIRKLDARFSGGAGGKWALWTGSSGKASLSAAALFDYQDFQVATGSAGPRTEEGARWSFRTKVEKKVSASTSLEHVAFFQPVWNDMGDYVFDVTHSLTTQMLGSLSLAIEHQYLHDATPPPDVGRDDQRFAVVLKLTF